MDLKFTPGPWEMVSLSGYGGPYAIRMAMPAGSRHPTHYGIQNIGTEANARMVAALPDLAEACRMLVGSYVEESGTYALGELYEARKKAQSALSAALGDQP